MDEKELSELLDELRPICIFSGDREKFRNKDLLLKILRKAVRTLDDFYIETKDKKQGMRISDSSDSKEKINL